MENDLGRLSQGVGGRVKGTDTILFIPKSCVPTGRKVTYCKQEAIISPNKEETHCVRNYAVGDQLDYGGPTTTQCASLTTTKLLVNSTISTPGAHFICFDINNYYYGTLMKICEYTKLHISQIT